MNLTLKLVLKDCWYERIESGLKTHEYREYKDFWIKRLTPPDKYRYVEFQKAYRKNAPKMKFKIKSITILPPTIHTDLNVSNPVFDIELGERCK